MRPLRWCLLAAALLTTACFLTPVPLDAKACDDAHACLDGYFCQSGGCRVCLDGDHDGALPLACKGGTDCDDTDPKVGPGNPELCTNGKDDDCNGKTDAEDPACRCTEDAPRPCGTCAGARQVCHAGQYGECQLPAELCDGQDNDCSGKADDGPGMDCVRGATEACQTSCATSGHRRCDNGCRWTACTAVELCDGLDNDCDNVKDNGFECVAGTLASCLTSCQSHGEATCSATCGLGRCTPPAESCNGADDDCDGEADNGFACVRGATGSNSASCDTACGSKGLRACNDQCTALDGACVAPAELCNGLDDDCDGQADNGLSTLPTGLLASGSAAGVTLAAASDGTVAIATSTAVGANAGSVYLAAGRGAALDAPSSLPRLTMTAFPAHPRDVEAAVGDSSIVAVWVDASELHVTVADRSASRVVRPETILDAVDTNTRPRIAFRPGAPGLYVISWLNGGRAHWRTLTEDGTPGTVTPANTLSTPISPLARSIPVAHVSGDTHVVLGLPVDAGGGMHPQVVWLDPLQGTTSTPAAIDWIGPGVLRDDGFELAAADVVTAAFAVVDSSTSPEVRQVLTAVVPQGHATHATPASPAGAPVIGLVRLAAQPGGAFVTWTELQTSAPTLSGAALFGGGPARVRRVDEVSTTYTPSAPAGAVPVFDGASYRMAWVDGERAVVRRFCP